MTDANDPEAPEAADDSPFLTEAEKNQLAANGHRLSALYGARAPTRSGQDWETHALAYLARANYTLQTILAIPTRDIDCMVLARSLYEHVVAFAWLLIDPPAHRPMLLRWEYEERVKLLNDSHGFKMLAPPSDTIVRRALIDMGQKAAPETPDRALAADKYWSRCNIKWTWRFRHGYWGLFRGFSVFVHPTVAGIDPFIVPGNRSATVGIPRAPHRGDIQAEAVLCFADALAVASHRFGWPSIGEVLEAFTHGLRPEAVANAGSTP
jgi:hypothetical protein